MFHNMKKRAVSMLVAALVISSVGCSPGLVNNDCDGLDRLSSSTGIHKVVCKLGNLF